MADDIHPIIAPHRQAQKNSEAEGLLYNRIGSGADKTKIDSMRAVITNLVDAQELLLGKRAQQMNQTKDQALMVLFVGGSVATSLAIILAILRRFRKSPVPLNSCPVPSMSRSVRHR